MSNTPKDLVLVEEGIALDGPTATATADDGKSETASVTTAPSVESGATEETTEVNTHKTRNKRLLLGGLVLAAVATAVVLGAVLGTKDMNNTSKSSPFLTTDYEKSYDDDGFVFEKPFGEIQLRPFTKDIFQGYATRAELEADLTLAAKDMVNTILEQNIDFIFPRHGNYNNDNGNGNDDGFMMHDMGEGFIMDDDANMNMAAQQAGMSATTASAAAQQATQTKIQKKMSLTNNQEGDADEADRVKNDDRYVYGAYGDYLVIWDRQTGAIVDQTQMVADEDADTDTDATEAPKDQYMDDYYYHTLYQQVYIDALQLTENHILVVVGGLNSFNFDPQTGTEFPDYKGMTQLRIFTKPTDEQPPLLVATQDLTGSFLDSRYLEATDSIHITTAMDTNAYSMLLMPLEVHNFPREVQTSRTLYLQAAAKLAEEESIPTFVAHLADLLSEDDVGSILQVNNGLTGNNTSYSMDEPIQGIVRVTSLLAKALPLTPVEDNTLPTSTSSFVGPRGYAAPYATQDSIVLNMARYQWDSDTQQGSDYLFLIHLKVDPEDASTTFHSMAKLKGHLPNKFSIDIQGNDLRVGTTLQKWMPMDTVWRICGDGWEYAGSCVNEDNWNQCFELAIDGCRNVIKTGCPFEYTCGENNTNVDEASISSTDNYIIVLDISQPGDMAEIGRVRIGEPHEVITAVKFGETFSYAMTFDQVSQ